MKVYCPSCDKLLYKIYTHPNWKGPSVRAAPGASFQQNQGQAPRIRCKCGTLVIPMKAEQ